uniref:Uncharacterized protein n=1 Tax=Arundo donax TaxID=35708 RepID=A0A0A9C3T1_ARUDO
MIVETNKPKGPKEKSNQLSPVL